jgi:hypothetical protein
MDLGYHYFSAENLLRRQSEVNGNGREQNRYRADQVSISPYHTHDSDEVDSVCSFYRYRLVDTRALPLIHIRHHARKVVC